MFGKMFHDRVSAVPGRKIFDAGLIGKVGGPLG